MEANNLIGLRLISSLEKTNGTITADEIRAVFGAKPGEMTKVILTPDITENFRADWMDANAIFVVWNYETKIIIKVIGA